ncbi:hypothetical protein AA0616_2060 [Komagataeibacter nataicola NRIC 0616]|nr:hypothetical protein AA0616_2060 [Komagataeibacter nataicola NRIC 0616]
MASFQSPQPPAAGWQDRNNNVDMLLGMPVAGRPAQIALPFDPCRSMPVTPIRPADLARIQFVIAHRLAF